MEDYKNLIDELFLQFRRAYFTSPEINYSDFIQGEMKILNYLYLNNSPVLPGKLCDDLYMTSARMSAALKSLKTKGYMERSVSKNDKRKIPVILTESGRSYFAEKRTKVINAYSEMFMKLGEDDTKEFIRIIKRLNDLADNTESEME